MVVRLSQMYIDMIKAFRADCDTLIYKFRNEKNSDLESFFQLWKSFNFNLVYGKKFSTHGMQYDFESDTLQIAKLIMLRDHFTSGLFLMYALFCLQGCPPGTIRLELGECLHILNILKLKKEEDKRQNFQTLWIFTMLWTKNAFKHVVFNREYDMEGQHRAEMIYNNQYDFSDDDSPKVISPKEWLKSFSKDIPKYMKELDCDYLKMKKMFKEVTNSLNLSLDMVQEDISTTLFNALTRAGSVQDTLESDNSIGARRRALKNRKMKIKYRYQLDESDEEIAPSISLAKPKRKRGCPRGERKLFFKKAINDPEDTENTENTENSSSDDSLVLGPRKLKTKYNPHRII